MKIKVKNLKDEEINLSDLSLDYWYDNDRNKCRVKLAEHFINKKEYENIYNRIRDKL